MHYFSQSSIFCVHPSAAAGLRQDFVNDRNGEILLCVTLPCITVRSFAERLRGWGAIGVVSQVEAYLPSASLEPVPGAPFWVGWRALDRF